MEEPITYQSEAELLREQAVSNNTPVTYTIGESPIPATTPLPEDSWLSSILKTVGKTAKESALPVIGGIVGSGLGTLATPFTGGIVNPVTGEMAGAAGGEWLNQMLGITEPSTTAIGISGALPGVGRLVAGSLKAAAKGTMAARTTLRQGAKAEMGQLVPTAAQEAKAFYEMADASGKTVTLNVPAQAGRGQYAARIDHTFQEAQQTLKTLANELARKGPGQLDIISKRVVRKQINEIEKAIEKTWPGYAEANVGYKQLQTHKFAQSFINQKDPLRSFEKALELGEVAGPTSMLDRGATRLKYLTPVEIAETKTILTELGKEPGEEIFKDLVKGRAVGHMMGILGGGAMGLQQGGWEGATAGAMTGLILPKVFNAMIAKGLSSPMTRAMLKGAIQSKTLTRPEFWGAFSQVLTRLGLGTIDMTPSDIIPQVEGQQ